MIAGLPMYDPPGLSAATDAWWAGLARALRRHGIDDVPDRLSRFPSTAALWQRQDLLLSQACGYDLVADYRTLLAYVATPCYRAEGCSGAQHSSYIVVSAAAPFETLEDLRGACCAVNEFNSHSGCNVLRATFAPLARNGRFFGAIAVSGSHVASLDLIASGRADVAAIDCVTYGLLARHGARDLDRFRIIERTVSVPVGPYVTRINAADDRVARLRDALFEAMQDPSLDSTRDDLLIGGFDVVPMDQYERISRMEADAAALGYRDLTPE